MGNTYSAHVKEPTVARELSLAKFSTKCHSHMETNTLANRRETDTLANRKKNARNMGGAALVKTRCLPGE